MIFDNITEWECVTKIQRCLSKLIKKYGKRMIVNALNTEIIIEHQKHKFHGTLTHFLYDQVCQCSSLLLIYDWHEIAKCIILYGGNIPNLLLSSKQENDNEHEEQKDADNNSVSPKPLLLMNLINDNNKGDNNLSAFEIEHIEFEWNICIDDDNLKHLFVYCLQNDIEPFLININFKKHRNMNRINDNDEIIINLRNANRCNIQSDLLLIYILKYQMECWNDTIIETINSSFDIDTNDNYKLSNIIFEYCYNYKQLKNSFDFVYHKLWKPLHLYSTDNNNRNSNLLRYISNNNNNNHHIINKQQTERTNTLCIIYSIIRKKDTGISAIRKLLLLAEMYEYDKNKNIDYLLNNVLKYHEIVKSRLFDQLIESNDSMLISSLLKYGILMDCQCSGLPFSSFANLMIDYYNKQNKRNKHKNDINEEANICKDFLRYNCSLCLYGIINFCHNTNNEEMDIINIFDKNHNIKLLTNKSSLNKCEDLLFRGLRPFATLTSNGNGIPSILYQRLEILNSNNNNGNNMNVNQYDTLLLFIIYFQFKKVKSSMNDLLRETINVFTNDLCNIVTEYLYINNHEIDLFFQWLFMNKMYEIPIQYILEYNILNAFYVTDKGKKFNIYSHQKQIKLYFQHDNNYWDWIYIILINNQRFIHYLINNKYHRLWLLNVIRKIVKSLMKLKQQKQVKRIIGFAKHHFNDKELCFLNETNSKKQPSIKRMQSHHVHNILQGYSPNNFLQIRRLNSL